MATAATQRMSAKRWLLAAIDVSLCGVAAALAVFLVPAIQSLQAVSVAMLSGIAALFAAGIYRMVASHMVMADVPRFLLASLGAGMLLFLAASWHGGGAPGLAMATLFAAFMAALIVPTHFIGGRFWRRLIQRGAAREQLVIYGAGQAGVQLAAIFRNSARQEVIAFLDDSPALQGRVLAGIRIHAPAELEDMVLRRGVAKVLLALPSVPASRRKELLERLSQLPVRVASVPRLEDITAGRAALSHVQEVDVADLLNRAVTTPDETLMRACIDGKNVLVTGAGGSIGSELCRQALRSGPAMLVLYEMSEPSLYAITENLRADADLSGVRIVPILGSTLDLAHIESVCQRFSIHTVYHAAAYKHVPIVEENIVEGVRNNIVSTANVAEAALRNGVQTFVLISSDKAVRPTSVMGASKRFSEMLVRAMAQGPGASTRFVIVRFGNVLGSSGSVVPKFRAQIAQGGPVTVTHKDIVRYFMTISEASQLVIQAGAMGASGDLFHLDMGAPVRIHDLARRIIHLSGYRVRDETCPGGDIEIRVTGLRPGEKLFEELLVDGTPVATGHPSIWRAAEPAPAPETVNCLMQKLLAAYQNGDARLVVALLRQAIPDFTPDGQLSDLMLGNPASGADDRAP